jgi:hypothetical protein
MTTLHDAGIGTTAGVMFGELFPSTKTCAIMSPAPLCFGHGTCSNITQYNNIDITTCACDHGWRSDGDMVFNGQCHINSVTITVFWIMIVVVGVATLIFLAKSLRLAIRVSKPSSLVLQDFRMGIIGWLAMQPRLRWICGAIVQCVAYVILGISKLSAPFSHVATHILPTLWFTIGSVVYFVLAADTTMRCASVIDVRNATGLLRRLWIIVGVALSVNTLSFLLLFLPIYDQHQDDQDKLVTSYVLPMAKGCYPITSY